MSDDRECTCHPDEAPVLCQKKYAFTECENERLREENARLREALKPFADIAPKYDPPEGDDDQPLYDTRNFPTIGMVRAAAAAIREGEK